MQKTADLVSNDHQPPTPSDIQVPNNAIDNDVDQEDAANSGHDPICYQNYGNDPGDRIIWVMDVLNSSQVENLHLIGLN